MGECLTALFNGLTQESLHEEEKDIINLIIVQSVTNMVWYAAFDMLYSYKADYLLYTYGHIGQGGMMAKWHSFTIHTNIYS